MSPTLDHAIEFAFLDKLRESGEINMYGSVPYLIKEFKIEKPEARTILYAWMKTRREERWQS